MADTLTLRQKILRDEYRALNDMQQQAVFATDGFWPEPAAEKQPLLLIKSDI